MGQTRLRPPDTPHAKGNERDQQDGGNEPSRDLVGQALDRCPRTLRIRYHLDDARQHRVAADLLGADDERAALVDRSSDDHIAYRLRDGHRLAPAKPLVERGSARLDLALDRPLFARPKPETKPDNYPVAQPLLSRLEELPESRMGDTP